MQDTGTWELREAEVGIDDAAIAGVMVEYLEWAHGRLLELYGVDDPPTDPRLVCQSLHEFRRPHGVLLLAESDGRPAGIGALRRLSADIAEVKRMYVVPTFRGRRISSAILDRLIREARAMGATTLRLDTCRFMSDAQRLYRSRGFAERTPYEGTEIPPRLQHHWVFFERSLHGATVTGAASAPD
jgi:GNAT superfamily N-acetyltransferase